jgi:hypothetical protein
MGQVVMGLIMMHRTIAVVVLSLVVGCSFAQPPMEPPPAEVPTPTPPFAPLGQGWVSADYMIGWISGPKLPPLVTTSPAGTPRERAGVFGQPTTTVLFEGRVNEEVRSGLKLGGGYWFDPERTYGIEGGLMFLGSQSALFSAGSNGSPILARPYTDNAVGAPAAVLIAFPNVSSGVVDVRASSSPFYEAHLNCTETVISYGGFSFNTLFGYRFYRYDEGLNINQVIAPTGGSFEPGTRIASYDNFATQHTFNGLDLGLRGKFAWQSLEMEVVGRAAVGRLCREVAIRGNTVTTVPGQDPERQTGGVYALVDNIGTRGSSDWAVFPEVGVTLRWQLTPEFGVRVGYSAFYLDSIARPSDQINLSINPNSFPPVSNFSGEGITRRVESDAWIQNVTFGAELTF